MSIFQSINVLYHGYLDWKKKLKMRDVSYMAHPAFFFACLVDMVG